MSMKKNNKYSETKIYPKLTRNKIAEEYCRTLEQMYTDVVSVPMFNDGDTHIEDWGIEFFHKESQQEIAWTIITCLMAFINNTGHTVSDILDNDELSFYAEIQERMCLGQEATIYKDMLGIGHILESDDD